MKPEEVLAELEDVLRTMPPRDRIRDEIAENFSWLGRAAAVLAHWNPRGRIQAPLFIAQMQESALMESQRGYLGLMVLLNEARSDLRMTTLGPINTAIGHGLVFDYFDEIRKQIELARTDLFFVDPYLDAEFVSRYLEHARPDVAIRLLARERLTTLVPAAKLFVTQAKAKLEIRSAPGFHDRYFFVDRTACFQSGASFKDGGKTAPTTITQITDAFAAVLKTYEDLWKNAKPEI